MGKLWRKKKHNMSPLTKCKRADGYKAVVRWIFLIYCSAWLHPKNVFFFFPTSCLVILYPCAGNTCTCIFAWYFLDVCECASVCVKYTWQIKYSNKEGCLFYFHTILIFFSFSVTHILFHCYYDPFHLSYFSVLFKNALNMQLITFNNVALYQYMMFFYYI